MSPRLSHGWGELRVLYDEPYKYVHGPRPKLFDLDADPRELDDLVDRRPEVAERMKADLAAFLRTLSASGASAAVHDASGDTRQRLAALGYLSTGGDDPGSVREELRSDGTPPEDRVGDNNLASRLRQQISRRDYLSARETALRLVERDPGNAFYRGMLAASYLGLGQLDEAVRVVEEGEAVMARNQEVYLQVANEIFAAGDKERGLAIARRVVGDRGTAYGHYLLAEMLGDLGDAAGRRRQLERAVELDPGHLRAGLALAIDLARGGASERAEEEFLALLERHPLEAKVHFNYAVLLLQLGRSEPALARLERAVELAPGYWEAHLARLATHLERGERERAEAVLALLRERCRDPEVLERANAIGGRG
jgi:tetratricopeptide (TPR) repeat protein